jgi:hypothetical protein
MEKFRCVIIAMGLLAYLRYWKGRDDYCERLVCQNSEHTQGNRSVITEYSLFLTPKLTKYKCTKYSVNYRHKDALAPRRSRTLFSPLTTLILAYFFFKEIERNHWHSVLILRYSLLRLRISAMTVVQ